MMCPGNPTSFYGARVDQSERGVVEESCSSFTFERQRDNPLIVWIYDIEGYSGKEE